MYIRSNESHLEVSAISPSPDPVSLTDLNLKQSMRVCHSIFDSSGFGGTIQTHDQEWRKKHLQE
jgi:hypothetical protein